MTQAKTQQDLILEVNGLEIRKNSIYKIGPKLDMSAPDGFVKAGTTKLPSEGIEDSVSCRYFITNDVTGAGVFDTGFYPASPCYKGLEESAKKEKVATLKKAIVKPFEEVHGEGILAQTNTEFWDSYLVPLYEGRVFNTETPEDLLALYIAVHSYELTPVKMDASPQFKDSSYLIEDSLASMSVGKKRNEFKFSAVSNFMNLIQNNREKLNNMLVYLKASRPNIQYTETDLKEVFDIWMNKEVQNAELFQNLYEKTLDEKGYEEVELTVYLQKLLAKGKIQKLGTQLAFKGTEIGIDAKSAARNLISNPELLTVKEELMIA